jgi:bifunctional DNA-binding transcriptional regulator/antitoxin component of YhaV-PrlF toxin-antitoxin module
MAHEQNTATRVVRPRRGGQITIPAPFRAELGIDDDTLLQVSLVAGELRIRPVRDLPAEVGSPWAKELYELFAPVRAEAAQYSEDELNALIDEAVREVRERRA